MKNKPAANRKAAPEGPSAASRRIGGQPENDEDARSAGLSSATPEAKSDQKSRPEAPDKKSGAPGEKP